MSNETQALPGLTVLDVIDNDDGTANVVFDVTDEFEEWFKEYHGIDEFDHSLFEKFVIESLEQGLELLDEDCDG
jgi:hypothetical protein